MEGYILGETYDFHYAWEHVCRLRLLVLQVWNEVSFHDSALFMLSLWSTTRQYEYFMLSNNRFAA